MSWLIDVITGRLWHWTATQKPLSEEMILRAVALPKTDFRNWLITFLSSTHVWLQSIFFGDDDLLKNVRARLKTLTKDSFRNLHAILLCHAVSSSGETIKLGDRSKIIAMLAVVIGITEESLYGRLEKYKRVPDRGIHTGREIAKVLGTFEEDIVSIAVWLRIIASCTRIANENSRGMAQVVDSFEDEQ